MTKLENKYIALLWWAIFMLILPWDQEKIVVVNLVIFCYFLYYMISSSVEETFEQRKNTIRQLLVQTINSRLSLLNNLISESRNFIKLYDVIALRFISQIKMVTFLARGFAHRANTANFFKNLTTSLEILSHSSSAEQLNKNLISVQLLSKSIKPSASAALALEE